MVFRSCYRLFKLFFIPFLLINSNLCPAKSQQLYDRDWLVDEIDTPSTVSITKQNTLRLANGLVLREFSLRPIFTTIEFAQLLPERRSLLRALSPEAVVSLDGLYYPVGSAHDPVPRAYMNRSAIRLSADPTAFNMESYNVTRPLAPYPYNPRRHAPKHIRWPPRGVTLNVYFRAPPSAPPAHRDVIIAVHYELYDGVPLIAKWLTVHGGSRIVYARVHQVEALAVNADWAPVGLGRDPACRMATQRQYQSSACALAPLFVETDAAHGTYVTWSRDGAENTEYGAVEPLVNATYQSPPELAISAHDVTPYRTFRVRSLLIGGWDRERVGLSRQRAFRLLAPQAQENPIFFHLTRADSPAFRQAARQLSEVGFEMIIYSFGSGFDVESENETYIRAVADDVAYARRLGLEVGAYDLVALTRRVRDEWMALEPGTNHSSGSACMASGWYDHLLSTVTRFMERTGLTALETDGPYGGYPCGSRTHAYHKGSADSVYRQLQKMNRFYEIMRERGVYLNQPDYYFYQGASKTALGYNENQYSLPRWLDLSISRQGMYDDTHRLIPTAGWMFVPLVDYHGGGAAASFEPLHQHSVELEWALAQYLGAGVAACYRGYRIYDGPHTRRLVRKWVSIYKRYRDIITSDLVHIRRPDMQRVDAFMHVNPRLAHARAFLMLFNPTPLRQRDVINIPLYYAGLPRHRTAARFQHEGGNRTVDLPMYGDRSVRLLVDMPPMNITWYVIM